MSPLEDVVIPSFAAVPSASGVRPSKRSSSPDVSGLESSLKSRLWIPDTFSGARYIFCTTTHSVDYSMGLQWG